MITMELSVDIFIKTWCEHHNNAGHPTFVIFPFHQNSSLVPIQISEVGVTGIVNGTDILCGNKDMRNMQLLLRQFNLCWASWYSK